VGINDHHTYHHRHCTWHHHHRHCW
jgi:hypothetical protein